jgi:hypothetical protein
MKMANLKFIGRILGGVGGLLMILIGILLIVNKVLNQTIIDLNISGIDLGTNFIANTIGGDFNWLVSAILMIILGLIALYGFNQLDGRSQSDLFVWGIIYIVIGLVGAGLGGFLAIVGGIVLIIDYFI